MQDAIQCRGVRKTFGPKTAVRGLDMQVARGSMTGFIGPNGAGKTTTIRMIMSILFPDTGTISVLGRKSALEAKDRIGYLPEERGVYKKMKVLPFLRYIARLKGAADKDLDARIGEWLERVDLSDVARKRCEELSKGMQQKIQFLSCVLHEPDLLILDEPFSGLDPVNMRLLRDLVLEQHRRGATVIFSTHVMAQAEQLCDHLIMIHDGEKVLDDTLEEIRARYDPRVVVFEPRERGTDPAPVRALQWVREVEAGEKRWTVHLDQEIDPSDALAGLTAAVPALRVELHRPSLEDIFVDIVGRSGRSPDDAKDLRQVLRSEPSATGQA